MRKVNGKIYDKQKAADYWILAAKVGRDQRFYSKFFIRKETRKIKDENHYLDSTVMEISRPELLSLIKDGNKFAVGFYNKKNNNYEFAGIVQILYSRKKKKYTLFLPTAILSMDMIGNLPDKIADDWNL